ncbi:MAG: hypothetical protein ABI175_30725, partial [Polyangiales bacterium]
MAFLLPDLTLEGSDVSLEPEAALLLWVALIEVSQRHAGLAVYEPESTPLFPHEGHFAPSHAAVGSLPTDAFYASTRRDELLWLELSAPKPGVVRLHTVARDASKQSFDAIGKNIGDQIQQVLTAWLQARGLAPLPRRFDSVSGEELIAVVRTVAPVLVEQARSWATPAKRAPSESDLDAVFGGDDTESGVEPNPLDDADESADIPVEIAEEDEAESSAPVVVPEPIVKRPRVARAAANRLPAPLKLPALRLLRLAMREDLDDLILAVDPEHPQALFEKYVATAAQGPDFPLLRRVIAAAPGWARPYSELVRAADDDSDDLGEKAVTPTELESVAGAGIAALCRPAHLDVIERVAALLDSSGMVDEGVRLLERALRMH